ETAGGLSVMVARVIPLFRTWVSFASGLARQPFGLFALYSSIGILIWNTLLLLSGHYLFTTGVAMQNTGRLWLMPAAGAGISLGAFMIRRYIKRRRQKGGVADSGSGG
ncbi:MAG: hypothetical protein FWF69_05090, partial [Firmicutes bacterium]|nr:hypothetical protein [Bacillota bacterium]